MLDEERCYRIASSRDGRFDGTFVIAVRTTGIYCRPSCPATTPRRPNVTFYSTPAAAQEAGYRACKRCRPDAAPGSPEWNARGDVAARVVRLISDGVVDREGVGGLARRLHYSTRQLNRILTAEIGTGALRLSAAHRLQNARALLQNTDLPVTDVAAASGFGSVRRFNEQVQAVFAQTPSQIRASRRAPAASPAPTAIPAYLTFRPPLDLDGMLSFLGRRAVPGVEVHGEGFYRTVVRLPHGPATVEVGSRVEPGPVVPCMLYLADVRDFGTAVSRLRRLLDLDADPAAVADVLGRDPALGPRVAARPGLRVPGAADPWEIAFRAVLGQHVSLASARAAAGRLVATLTAEAAPLAAESATLTAEAPLAAESATLTAEATPLTGGPARPGRAIPGPEVVAAADPATFGLPAGRARCLQRLACAVAGGDIDLGPGADRDRTEKQLLAIDGIGPWTAAYIRMRGLGDPDVLPPGDVHLERLLGPQADSTAWRPWRSYAAIHLWTPT